ncbi:hypothetical protein BJY00DRAFT_319409 [Aspergillus carlsbadensis]|nr:hypothetical protein BJY00DRAFT_319409 [Aspergillus carlsbadensis]
MRLHHTTTRPLGKVTVKSAHPIVCILCGERVGPCCACYVPDPYPHQESSTALPDGSVIPAAKMKQDTYPWLQYSTQSSCYFRVVTKDPKTQQLSVSEIGSPSTFGISWWTLRARFVNPTAKHKWWPAAIDTACILYPDQTHPPAPPRKSRKRRPVSYAVHVDCWEFLDRIIGHDLVTRHWETFIDLAQKFWIANMDRFGCRYDDGSRVTSSQRRDVPVNEVVNPWDPILPLVALKPGSSDSMGYRWTVHEDSGQLGFPDMHELAEKVVRRPRRPEELARAAKRLARVDIPVELAMMIVEMVRISRTDRLERVRDTRNMLVAFEWMLPDSYWISRSNGFLKFEMQADALDSHVDWATICLSIEEMWLRSSDCSAATRSRAQALGALGIMRGLLLKEVEKEKGKPQSGELPKKTINRQGKRTIFRGLGWRSGPG